MKKLVQISGRNHLVLIHQLKHNPDQVMPVLWLFSEGGAEAFPPLIDYFVARSNYTLSWKRRAARAIGLFYDFCLTYRFDERNSLLNVHYATLKAFIEAIKLGTVPRCGIDRTGLYWAPMSAIMAAETARHIDKFVQFASESIGHLGEQHPLRVLYRHISRVPTNQAELVGFLMAAKSLSSRSFLRHVKNDQDEAEKLWRASRTHLGQEEPVSGSRSIKKMNSNLIGRILEVGFIRNESATSVFDREDVTAKMVFLLLVGAGVRISEPFHMWFNDVTFADLNGEQRCLPMLRHPSQAGTFIEGEGGSRRLYLIQRGLSPRNEAHKKALWAGWKNLPLDKSQAQTPAHFLHDGIEFLFAQYYFKYLGYRRELVAARVARGEGDHPFLFVSRGEDRAAGRSCIGDPYSIGAFRSAWDRALDRVERTLGEVVPRGKEHGTTPHALRHAYGRALEKCGVGQKAIQKAMHHRHILSQSPYTEPEWKQVSEALSLARSGGALLNGRPVAGVLNPYDETVELVERWRI